MQEVEQRNVAEACARLLARDFAQIEEQLVLLLRGARNDDGVKKGQSPESRRSKIARMRRVEAVFHVWVGIRSGSAREAG